MNYLAHLFLSCENEDLLVGNIIADFIRNADAQQYPEAVQKGLFLHRQIDSFTDNHPQVREGTKRLHPLFHKYSPVIIDIYYDYLLANNWEIYSSQDFSVFRLETYTVLEKRMLEMPPKLKMSLPNMIAHDWLKSYQNIHGLQYTFDRLESRLNFPMDLSDATSHLLQNIEAYSKEFHTFFPEVIEFVRQQCDC